MKNLPNPFDGDISNEAILAWLEQFDLEDRPVILKLLSAFKYYSSRKVPVLVKNLYAAITSKLATPQEKLWFVPVGYVAKSGSIIAYYFRTHNNLPQGRFITPSDIKSLPLAKGDVVVFLDDYVGSGNQACQVWQNVVAPVKESSECRFAYAVLVGSQNGLKQIHTSTDFITFAVEVLTDKDKPFSPKSNLFRGDAEKKHAKTVAEKYGKRLYPNHPLGYNESQGLVGFFYSTPNNTLPIFWSTETGWTPILAHGESYRDPVFLIGPPPGLTREIPCDSPRKPLIDLEELDQYDMDPVMVTTILSEFRKLNILLVLVSVLKELNIGDKVFTDMLKLISQLKYFEHEKEPVRSALLVVPEGIPEKLIGAKMLSARLDVSFMSVKEVLALSNLVDGFKGAVVFRPGGQALGNFLYLNDEYQGDTFLPETYQPAASASAKSAGLLLLFSGKGRVSVFYKGQRILSHRGAMWHLQNTKLERAIQDLSNKHHIDVPVLQAVFKLTFILSDRGKGALLTVGDHEAVVNMSDSPKTEYMQLVELQLGKSEDEAILGLMSQDGATIISGNGRIVQGMTFLRPPAGINAVEEVGKGSKHSTASKTSKVTKAVCIAVSVDGRITVYSNGAIFFKMMG